MKNKSPLFYVFLIILFTLGGLSFWNLREITKSAEYASWKTYTNEQYGFQFQYPEDVALYFNTGTSAPQKISEIKYDSGSAYWEKTVHLQIFDKKYPDRYLEEELGTANVGDEKEQRGVYSKIVQLGNHKAKLSIFNIHQGDNYEMMVSGYNNQGDEITLSLGTTDLTLSAARNNPGKATLEKIIPTFKFTK